MTNKADTIKYAELIRNLKDAKPIDINIPIIIVGIIILLSGVIYVVGLITIVRWFGWLN